MDGEWVNLEKPREMAADWIGRAKDDRFRAKAGMELHLKLRGSDRSRYELVGTMNENLGICDCCTYGNGDDRWDVVAYRVIWEDPNSED